MAIFVHWILVAIPGSLLFRETHVDRIWMHITKNPFAGSQDDWIGASVVLGLVVMVSLPLIFSFFVERYLKERLEQSEWLVPIQTTTWAVLGVFMFVFYRVSTYDFIYFQF